MDGAGQAMTERQETALESKMSFLEGEIVGLENALSHLLSTLSPYLSPPTELPAGPHTADQPPTVSVSVLAERVDSAATKVALASSLIRENEKRLL